MGGSMADHTIARDDPEPTTIAAALRHRRSLFEQRAVTDGQVARDIAAVAVNETVCEAVAAICERPGSGRFEKRAAIALAHFLQTNLHEPVRQLVG